MRCPRVVLAALGIVVSLGAACSDDAPACVEVDLTCQPLYEPTFPEVFERTLLPKCGTAGASCHSIDGNMNGLVFADADGAYAELLGTSGEDSRVEPGDPGCSEVIRRLTSDDADLRMPPGAPLAAGEQCALIQWIAAGAQR